MIRARATRDNAPLCTHPNLCPILVRFLPSFRSTGRRLVVGSCGKRAIAGEIGGTISKDILAVMSVTD